MTLTASEPSVDITTDLDTDNNRATPIFIAIFGASIAAMDIIGWSAHLRWLVQFIPTMPAMAFPTAICFLIASAAIHPSLKFKSSEVIYAASISLVTIAAEIFYFSQLPFWNSGVPAKAVLENFPSNGMSPNVAFLFNLLAATILLVNKAPKLRVRAQHVTVYQLLCLGIVTISFVCLVSYPFGILHQFGLGAMLGMAPTTAILLILYSSAVLFSRRQEGVLAVLESNSIAGRSARRLLPIAVVAPGILGVTITLALELHSQTGFFLAFLIVVGSTVLRAVVIWDNLLALHEQVLRAEEYQDQLAEIERNKIASVLEATKDRLSLAIEGAQLGSWHWDLLTGERVWSDQCKRLFGVDLSTEMSLETLMSCILPEDQHLLREAREKAISNNADYSVEYRVVWPDGSIHWIDSRGKAYCGTDGKAIRFEGISQDVSIRHLLQERQQQFLRDMLVCVTDAKLMLCLGPNDLPELFAPAIEPVPITVENGGIRELRDAAFEVCQAVNLPIERCYDMKTAVGEAAMNSAVHAQFGVGQVFVGNNGTVQVKIVDHGGGIALENLPNATLKKGYTTAGTLGHGMKMMLQTVDRIFLLTGSTGTTVLLEKDRESKEALW